MIYFVSCLPRLNRDLIFIMSNTFSIFMSKKISYFSVISARLVFLTRCFPRSPEETLILDILHKTFKLYCSNQLARLFVTKLSAINKNIFRLLRRLLFCDIMSLCWRLINLLMIGNIWRSFGNISYKISIWEDLEKLLIVIQHKIVILKANFEVFKIDWVMKFWSNLNVQAFI